MNKPSAHLIFWMLSCVILGVTGLVVGLRVIVPGPSSLAALKQNAGERVAIEHGLPPCDGLLVLVMTNDRTFSDLSVRSSIEELTNRLRALRRPQTELPLFALVQSPTDADAIDTTRLISKDQSSALIIAQSGSPVFQSGEDFSIIPETLRKWGEGHPDFSYHYLSHSTGESEVLGLIKRDLDHSLIYTVPITLIILVWAFGSFIAATIPLVIAGMSLAASLGMSAIVSQYIEGISATSSQFVVLLVLAIGIDYSLFYITRAREELTNGSDIDLAIRITQKSTGRAIFWSGVVVSVSLLGLMLMKDTVLNSMALVAIISVLITLASCLYALPHFLTVFLPHISKHVREKKQQQRITEMSLTHPVLSVVVVSIVLGALSYYSRFMNLGNTMIPELLPRTLQGIDTYYLLKEKFPDLTGGDISIIVYGQQLEDHEASGEMVSVLNKLNEHGLRGPVRSDTSDDYFVERHKFLVNATGNEPKIKSFISELQERILPQLVSSMGLRAEVAGIIPYALTEAQRYSSRMPLILAAVLGLSGIFLFIAFKSIVIPIKAIILNLLSTGASFGILVIIFQSGSVGIFHTGVIESFIPPLLFAILFGLSMDYHVFILARITEEYRRGADTQHAVKIGIQETSRTITSAALIMVSVFLVAATLELPVMRQLGIGLAAAVMIDATLIRTILLPASMVLLGKWNWYWPWSSSSQ